MCGLVSRRKLCVWSGVSSLSSVWSVVSSSLACVGSLWCYHKFVCSLVSRKKLCGLVSLHKLVCAVILSQACVFWCLVMSFCVKSGV